MLYFAELDYKHILYIKDIEGLEDSTLVLCEQCVEKYLKHLIRKQLGEVEKSSHLPFLMSKLSDTYPELKQYVALSRFLKDCYFERRYENEDYVELEPEEYQNYVKESLEMIQYLQGLILV